MWRRRGFGSKNGRAEEGRRKKEKKRNWENDQQSWEGKWIMEYEADILYVNVHLWNAN
jgi:hypothetical protein